MRDEIKQAILSKNSFLIYGPDAGCSMDIFDELAQVWLARHNEIFYFNTYDSGINPEFTKTSKALPQRLNPFEFFKEKEISQYDLVRYISDICNYLHSEFLLTKVDGKESLEALLKDVYSSKFADEFNIDELVYLFRGIVKTHESLLHEDLFDTLDKIRVMASKNPDDYIIDPEFDNLTREARLQLERLFFKFKPGGKYMELELKYSKSKSATKYFSALLEKMQRDDLMRFQSSPEIMPGKINYFRKDYSFKRNFLNMYLSSLVRKLKIHNSPNRPLVVINGKQKDLFENVNMDIEELFNRCTICFIISSGEDLDARINSFVDVKIYSHKHKKLSLPDTFTEKRIENNYSVYSN